MPIIGADPFTVVKKGFYYGIIVNNNNYPTSFGVVAAFIGNDARAYSCMLFFSNIGSGLWMNVNWESGWVGWTRIV